jgi:hypothetical protein
VKLKSLAFPPYLHLLPLGKSGRRDWIYAMPSGTACRLRQKRYEHERRPYPPNGATHKILK